MFSKKRCKKGKSCGMGCISSTKTCKVRFSPEVNRVLENKSHQMLYDEGTTAAGTMVRVLIEDGQVMFDVNNDVDTGGAKAPDPIAAGKLAMALAKKLISELPDGTIIWNEPYRGDSKGDARVRVYQKLGFGPMLENGTQWAVKKEGKLIPITRLT